MFKTPYLYRWIAALAVLVMLLRAGSTVRVFNHTIDESFHIAAGVGLYQTHKHVADATHPPVAWLVGGFPLWRLGVRVPSLEGSATVLGFPQMEAVARKAMFEQRQSYWTILTQARLAMLIFPIIALLHLYLLGTWLADERVAMLAVVLFSADPTLLGHRALFNNDVPAGTAFICGLYYALRWIVSPTYGRAVVAGLVLGLGLATKFTLLLLFPSLALILLFRPLPVLRAARVKHRLRAYFSRWPSIGQFALAGCVGFIAIWATYLFDIGKMSDQNFFDYTPKWNQIPQFVRNATIPMPSLPLGFLYQMAHRRVGHMSYLNGQMTPRGSLMFFPESLLLKEPLALIAAFVLAVVVWGLSREKRVWRTLLIVLPAFLYLEISTFGRIMIGIRHLLPMLPLIYLFIAFVLARTRALPVLVGLIAIALIETAMVAPDYLAYGNALAGGPRGLHRYFADSNIDWGQDVARLAHWLKTDPRAQGRPYTLRVFMSSPKQLLEELGLNPDAQEAQPHGLFAISQSARVGIRNYEPDRPDTNEPHPDYAWLHDYPKISEIGSTIDVYDLGTAPTTNLAGLPIQFVDDPD